MYRGPIRLTAGLCVAFAAIASVAAADPITLAWDPSSDQAVNGYVLYVDGPSGYSRNYDVGPASLFVFPDAVAGQQYCFSIASYSDTSSGRQVGTRSAQVCGYSNAAPSLANPGNQTSALNQPTSLQLAGGDVLGQVVSYSATGLPPGLTLASASGFISGTPTTAGTYQVTARVSDGVLSVSQSFSWAIVAADLSLPVVTITAPTTGSSYSSSSPYISLYGTASDSGGIARVTWITSRGETGTANGTNSWYTNAITLANGSNLITVTAYDTSGNTATDTLTVNYGTVSVLTLNSLTANRTAPQLVGTPITFTALTSGGSAPQFKWLLYDGANWLTAQNWTTSSTWTWTPTSANSAYRVGVWVRNGTSTADTYDNAGSNGSISFPISSGTTAVISSPSVGTLVLNSLTANQSAPQPVGASITFAASAGGGTAPYQYKWWLFDGVTWNVTRDWTSSNTWTWTPSSASSAYRIGVWVRNAGSTVDLYDNSSANGSISFAISAATTTTTSSSPAPAPTGGALTLTSIAANRNAPQPVGTSLTFAATATGGTAPYQYKWWVYDGVDWFVSQDWTSNNQWTWTPTLANSAYRIGVWVRSATNAQDIYDNSGANGSIGFAISGATSSSSTTSSSTLALLSITPDRALPTTVGTTVTFTATASGGTAPYQYKWWIYDGTTWIVMQNWTSNRSWSWTPTRSNAAYRVAVWVRSATSTADMYDNAASNGSIATPVN